ncbi:MAG: YggS family pyridoxal phosphate-dependent enzyme, partial [Nitrospiria bacterium]
RLEQIEEAAGCGVRVFGENRVQEATAKFLETGLLEKIDSVHLIGPLQTNKVKRAVGFFDLIHSIDSVHLAEKVEQEAAKRSIKQSVLVEVNIGGEVSKHGVSVEETPYLVEAIRGRSHLSLFGLMTIPPYHPDPERARPYFSALRELGMSLGLSRLSMGMSADFRVAIEEGATWVRIGTAIFGPREG